MTNSVLWIHRTLFLQPLTIRKVDMCGMAWSEHIKQGLIRTINNVNEVFPWLQCRVFRAYLVLCTHFLLCCQHIFLILWTLDPVRFKTKQKSADLLYLVFLFLILFGSQSTFVTQLVHCLHIFPFLLWWDHIFAVLKMQQTCWELWYENN